MILGRNDPDATWFALDLHLSFSQHHTICHHLHLGRSFYFQFPGPIALNLSIGGAALSSDLGIVGEQFSLAEIGVYRYIQETICQRGIWSYQKIISEHGSIGNNH